ncbi:glycosyltransferase [Grimontia sp. NTOU-MAR1]|uniref:glycosyltransferase n=1 Tax=Grimontia sp. NTOU-MAR1 TaxID=3111011 RepID=UPI002DBB515D|nr:glycosyltransferase [Grimontia sp. NTOU-MAR1]WRW00440.1 glycosyltransferase [Grimontia sp. NTOU-MAR1]
MVYAKSPRQICHIVNSLNDTAQNDLVFANIRQFPQPHYEHTLVVLNKSKVQPMKLPRQVSCLELTLKGSFYRRLRECNTALSALKPHVCQTYGDNTFPVQWLAHRLGIPVKLHIDTKSAHCDGAIGRTIRRWKYRLLSHSADFVITPEDEGLVWLKEKVGLESGKAHLIRTGIDNRQHCPPLREVDPNITNHFVGTVPIPTQRFVVGVPVSGVSKSTVLAFFDEYMAARKLSPSFACDCLLLILGNSPHLRTYRVMLDSLNVTEECVRFYSHLTDNHRFFSHIDAIVSFSDDNQTPVALLQAMSMGLPVITNRSESNESNGVHPLRWQVPNTDPLMQHQLLTLFLDDHLRLRLGQASRAYVMKRHNLHEHRIRYRALYELAQHEPALHEEEALATRISPSQLNR